MGKPPRAELVNCCLFCQYAFCSVACVFAVGVVGNWCPSRTGLVILVIKGFGSYLSVDSIFELFDQSVDWYPDLVIRYQGPLSMGVFKAGSR